jgi:hypothetical protein
MWWNKPKQEEPKPEAVPPITVMVRSPIEGEGPATYTATHVSTNARGELWLGCNGASVAVYAAGAWISAGTVATAKEIEFLLQEVSAAKERLEKEVAP